MRRTALILTLAGTLGLAASALATVTVYRNDFAGRGRVAEFRKVGAGRCTRVNDRQTMTLRVGASTVACSYRSPVIGRNLEVAVTTGLLAETPRALQSSVATAVALRSDGQSSYSLAVFQRTKRWVLTRTSSAGSQTLQKGRLASIRTVGRANRLVLRVFGADVAASINAKTVARYTDPNPNELSGSDAAVLVFGTRSARGSAARFDSVSVRVPDPK
jgi:hypothetical protein